MDQEAKSTIDTCIKQMESMLVVGKVINKIFWFTMPFLVMLFIAIVTMSYNNSTNVEIIKVNIASHIKDNERDFQYIKERLDMKVRECIVRNRSIGNHHDDNSGS
jgi:hypothetical protein